MQFFIPTVSCAMLNSRPGTLPDGPDAVVACDRGADVHTKYALDVVKVAGTDLEKAEAADDPSNGGWHVKLHFTTKGQARWTGLTQEAMQTAEQSIGGGGTQVAMLLDDQVISAPVIKSVIVGDGLISGNFDEQSAKLLAANLNYGALPVRLTITAVNTIR
jgi:preprotein translocase subunit SecD